MTDQQKSEIEQFLIRSKNPWPTITAIFGNTQREISRRITTPPSHISRIWAGRVNPTRATITHILEGLPVHPTWIPRWAEDIGSIPDWATRAAEADHANNLGDRIGFPTYAATPAESLSCAIRLAQGLADPATQSGTLHLARRAALAVITANPDPAIRWQSVELVWILWLALRAVEHIVEWGGDIIPAPVVQARASVYAGDNGDEALQGIEALMAYARHWGDQKESPDKSLTPATNPDDSTSGADSAWAVIQGAWAGLDLADRARIADLALRLARQE